MTSPRTRSRRWSFRPTGRAKQIEEDAKTELQKLRRQSLETIEQVRRQLEETKENYRVMLARSQQESQEMARRAGEVIGRDRPHLGLPRKKHNGKIEKRAARYAEQSAPENGGKIKWLIMI